MKFDPPTGDSPVEPSSLLPEASGLLDLLERATPAELDALPFGVVGMERGGLVTAYNAFEAQRARLSARDVVGRDFFFEVAPCTNNAMIRGRFVAAWEAGTPLDEQIPYTFSFRMTPTRVRLRLLARGGRGWLIVSLR